MAGSWKNTGKKSMKWHQTSQMSFPFSFLTTTSLLRVPLCVCSGYCKLYFFFLSFFVFNAYWHCHYPNNLGNVFKCTSTMLNKLHWQWQGFVCKVVLNEIPDTSEDNTHLTGIFTEHCASFMVQMDYGCIATSNHITKILDKILTAISALSI